MSPISHLAKQNGRAGAASLTALRDGAGRTAFRRPGLRTPGGLGARTWGNPSSPTDGSIAGDFHPHLDRSWSPAPGTPPHGWVLDGHLGCRLPQSSSSPRKPTPAPGSHSSGPGLPTTRPRTEDAPTPPSPTARLSPSTTVRCPYRLLWAAPRPVAPAWVTAWGPAGHPASSSLRDTAFTAHPTRAPGGSPPTPGPASSPEGTCVDLRQP